MKSIINLFFFFTLSAQANPIYLFHEQKKEDVLFYRNLLIDKYKIPGELISINEVNNCSEISVGGKFDLCLKKNGDLISISVDKEFINQTLKIFQLP